MSSTTASNAEEVSKVGLSMVLTNLTPPLHLSTYQYEFFKANVIDDNGCNRLIKGDPTYQSADYQPAGSCTIAGSITSDYRSKGVSIPLLLVATQGADVNRVTVFSRNHSDGTYSVNSFCPSALTIDPLPPSSPRNDTAGISRWLREGSGEDQIDSEYDITYIGPSDDVLNIQRIVVPHACGVEVRVDSTDPTQVMLCASRQYRDGTWHKALGFIEPQHEE